MRREWQQIHVVRTPDEGRAGHAMLSHGLPGMLGGPGAIGKELLSNAGLNASEHSGRPAGAEQPNGAWEGCADVARGHTNGTSPVVARAKEDREARDGGEGDDEAAGREKGMGQKAARAEGCGRNEEVNVGSGWGRDWKRSSRILRGWGRTMVSRERRRGVRKSAKILEQTDESARDNRIGRFEAPDE